MFSIPRLKFDVGTLKLYTYDIKIIIIRGYLESVINLVEVEI